MPIIGTIASSYRSATVGDTGSMFPISAFTLPSAQANVQFSSIPQTYTHLQLRILAKTTNATDIFGLLEINGVSGTRCHELYSDGSNIAGYQGANNIFLQRFVGTNASNTFTAIIVDILDYKNTNKTRVTRQIGGYNAGTSGVVAFTSGLLTNTAAITSLRISMGAGNIAANSSLALYGIK